MRTDIENTLGIHDFKVMGSLPDRPNIFLDFRPRETQPAALNWLIDDIRTNGLNTPKTLIYCPSITKVSKLHEWIMGSLGEKAWCDPKRRSFETRLVAQFHKSVGAEMEELVLTYFTKKECNIRVLVCTVAFGMGVNIPDIAMVVHWGLSESLQNYWQEVGRCARGTDQTGKAILFPIRLESNDRVFLEMVKGWKTEPKCMRYDILSKYKMEGIDTSNLDSLKNRQPCNDNCIECNCHLCRCCTFCKVTCQCNIELSIRNIFV